MPEPEYRLSGVLRDRGVLTDFSGPLSLILQLMSRNRIEIRDISVSLILEQYLAWIDEMAELDLEIASEFITMASHLMYIKSKMLLGEAEPHELTELITSLERLRSPDIYAQIKPISAMLADMYFIGAGLITKQPETISADTRADYSHINYSHTADELVSAFEMIMLRTFSTDEIVSLVSHSAPAPIAFPIDTKIREISEMLRIGQIVSFNAILRACGGRSETVAAFLAVLELCSSGYTLIDDDYNLILLWKG